MRQTVGAVGGVVAALVAFEIALRPLVTSYGPPRPRIADDRLDAPAITVRQVDEGIAESHFSIGGARLTGHAPIDGAPIVIIFGDSYVVAREVRDEATMGARLEDRARGAGAAINVRQYAWRGASPARYLLAARQVLERWNPRVVVVALSSDDFSNSAPIDGPQLRVDDNGFAQVVGDDEGPGSMPVPGSSLGALGRLRSFQVRRRMPLWVRRLEASPAPQNPAPWANLPRTPTLPRATIRSLAKAFGDRLAVVYMAEVLVTGGETTDVFEDSVLAGCRGEHVRCVSTRPVMLEARRAGVLAHGQPTGDPGLGHLNAAGHALVGNVAWDLVKDDLRRLPGSNR